MDGSSDEIKKQIGALANEFSSLFALSRKDNDFVEFSAKYQNWYSRAVKLVALLGSDRLEEFKSYYLIDPKRKGISFGTYVIRIYPTISLWTQRWIVAMARNAVKHAASRSQRTTKRRYFF